MKKIGKQIGKQIAVGVATFGFVAASALVSAQEIAGRQCQEQVNRVQSEQEIVTRHQAQLHEQLQLTADQEPAWQEFVASMPSPTKPAHLDRTAMEKLTTPERMEQQLNMLKEQEAKMSAHLVALKTFYAALTPEQQKTFDEYHARIGRNAHHKSDA